MKPFICAVCGKKFEHHKDVKGHICKKPKGGEHEQQGSKAGSERCHH